MLYSAQKVSFRTSRCLEKHKRKKEEEKVCSRSRPTHATTTARTTLVSKMLHLKDFEVIEFQFFVSDNILILLIFLIIKSLKSRKNT